MEDRKSFLERLREYRKPKRRNRRISEIQADEKAKEQRVKLYKKIGSALLAGTIAVGSFSAYKSVANEELEFAPQSKQEMVLNHVKNDIPAPIYIEKGKKIEELQKQVQAYNELDSAFGKFGRLFNSDTEKESFSKLEQMLKEKDPLIEETYLDLIKYSIAKDKGIKNYKNIETKYDASGGELFISAKDKLSNIVFSSDELTKAQVEAIADVGNYQCLRNMAMGDKGKMAEIVSKLTKQMMDFSKTIKKDRTKIAEAKSFDEER